MKVLGIKGVTWSQLEEKLSIGGRFVVFRYCISLLVVTLRRSSAVYYIPPGKFSFLVAFLRGLPYTLLSALLGWWKFPKGPTYTIQFLIINTRGGKDVTVETVQYLRERTGI